MRSSAELTWTKICCKSSETVTMRSASATFDPSSAIWFPKLPFSSSWSTPIDRISAAMYDMSLSISARRSSRRLRRVSCWRLFIIFDLRLIAGYYQIQPAGYRWLNDHRQTIDVGPWRHGASRSSLPDRCQRSRHFYTPLGVTSFGASAVVGNTHGLRLAITGGGTGGHVLPALAVADELRRRDALTDLVWIGSRDGVEREAAEAANIRFVVIPTGKLRRYLSMRNLSDAARVPLGVLAARRALAAFRPDVVLSTGGFVSVPAAVAARGIAPVLTHEQTAILGLANRINARFAAVLAVSHRQTEQLAGRFHRQVIVTGNPIRVGLTTGDRSTGLRRLGFDPALPVVYVTGGARGASPINQRIAALLPGILDQTQIVHQTGPLSANTDALNLTELRETLPEAVRHRYHVVEFLGEELADIYAVADLVVGRAGAGTIAELAYVGLPAILVPLPGAGGDEQARNAKVLGDAGGAVVIQQPDATPERLQQEILSLLGDPERRARMAKATKTIARPDAAARLSEELLSIARQR